MEINLGEKSNTPHKALNSGVEEQKLRRAKDPTINANDVLCGRGKSSFNHVGNRRFRDIITASVEDYNKAVSRGQKTLLFSKIEKTIRDEGGRFLKYDESTGKWHKLDDRQAKDKVGHAIRDAATQHELRAKKRKKSNAGTSDDADDEVASRDRAFGLDSLFSENESLLSSTGYSGGKTDTESMSEMDYSSSNLVQQPSRSIDAEDDFVSIINDVLGPDGMEEDPLRAFLDSS